MAEHYSSSTVSAEKWCGKCKKFTQHRVDGHRAVVCLNCSDRLEREYQSKPKLAELARQQNLFVQGVDL